ncbi:MAG: hypothetical protein ACR2HR_14435 [Euzebya sp.]
MKSLVITRPQPIRIAALLTLVVIVTWAAVNANLSDFGVLAYPALIALQTAREWSWRLEVGGQKLHERQGIGPPRDIDWKKVEAVLMPDSAWWRINPVLKVDGAPNIQMTAGEDIDAVIRLAQKKRKPIVGDPASISLVRSLTPWIVLLAFACLLLGFQLSGVS